VIGIATQTLEAVPGKLPRCWVMGQRYVRSLTSVGATPWLIPSFEEEEECLRAIYDKTDGIFLTGGVDVDPAHYGEQRHELCERSDSARDWTELHLIRWALADKKPILGVCRGLQVINVACGGSLYQHLADQHPHAIKHDFFPSAPDFSRDFLAHGVRVEAGTRLNEILGAGQCEVNSMHHQGIKRLAPGLRATAFASDGLIEGVESANGTYLVGVQWHPEELAESMGPMRRLFADFIEAADSNRSR
jgi:putative glutamine amidotransferase